jgi:hypothetical protein
VAVKSRAGRSRAKLSRGEQLRVDRRGWVAMLHFYFGKHIKRAQAGGRVVRVACARCQCEYFYHLTRIGIGHGEAPYYIGVGRATRTAEKQAKKDLERRLTREAELVPCPRFRNAEYTQLVAVHIDGLAPVR